MPVDEILQYAIYFLLIVLIVIGIRYLWLGITQRVHHPEMWTVLRKRGKIPASVVSIEKQYPDKVRLYNFWFQLMRLDHDSVEGAMAELGVYKGESAEIIHQCAPERDFYLFDTFSGFMHDDIVAETGEAATYTEANFADTDMQVVKQRLGESRHIIYKKGYFPGSAKGLEEEKFAFVSIDADLYKPVKAALRFFYPRLSPGGVIIIHDYNEKWAGLMKAVDDFVKDIPETLIHVPDRYGSVMVVKNKLQPH
ncbi:MAG: TylF/MycF/NovP-related O-methyltransferase [Bacteroidales bacterium]|nr:TylF/MycF/NovP-related O-methyltransferase [Bacteroidales bacterium]